MVHQFEQVLLDIRRQREALYKEFEREMLELVFSISKKVIHHELTLQEGLVQKALEEAFQNVVDRKRIVVHLHPADYQFLLNHPDRFPFIRGQTEGIRVVEDPSISRGGCLLETSFGEVDATIEGQFAEIVSSIWSQWASQERETEKSTP
jgi:flagellar assembly protein FliH